MHVADFRLRQLALCLLNRAQNRRHARITAVTDIVLLLDVLGPPELGADCRFALCVSGSRAEVADRTSAVDEKSNGSDAPSDAAAGALCDGG